MFKQHTPDPNDTLLLPTRAGNTVCILYCAYFTAFIVLCILYKGHRLKHVNGDERDPYTQTPQTHPSMIPMMMLLEDVPKTHQTRDTENDDNFERYNRTTLCTFSKSANVIFLFFEERKGTENLFTRSIRERSGNENKKQRVCGLAPWRVRKLQ